MNRKKAAQILGAILCAGFALGGAEYSTCH